MSRLSIPIAKEKLDELEYSLIKARLLAGILSSSDREKERIFRRVEKLLCEALEEFDKIEVGEKEDKHGIPGMDTR